MRGISKLYSCECEIEGCETNSSLVDYFLGLDNSDSTPSTLNCSDNYLGSKASIVVCKMLQAMRWVRHVSLRAVGMNELALKVLCDVAASHPSLESIDIRGNVVFATSARQLAAAAKKNPKLWRIMHDGHEIPPRIATELQRALSGNVALQLALEEQSFRVVVEDRTPQLQQSLLTDSKFSPALRPLLEDIQASIQQYVYAFDSHSQIVPRFVVDFGVRELPILMDSCRDVSLEEAICLLRTIPSALVAEVTRARKSLLQQQVEHLFAPKATSAELASAGPAPTAEPAALLRHVVNTLVKTSLADTSLFAHVEDELLQLLERIKTAYTDKRTLLLLSDQCKYFLVQHRGSSWVDSYRRKERSIRVDGSAAIDSLEQVLAQPDVPARYDLAMSIRDVLPRDVLQWIACEACGDRRAGVGALGLLGLVASVRSEKQWVSLFYEEFAPWYRLRAIAGRCGPTLLQFTTA